MINSVSDRQRFLSDAIGECLDKRNSVQDDRDNEGYIEMTADVYDAVMGLSWLSK